MSTQTDFLTGIANAIRAKKGTSASIPAQNFAAEIAAIQTGYDTADATGGAGQMLSPYTAYGPNGKFTGAIPSQNATTITPGTAAKTAIPAGTYAAGAATVAGDANLVSGNIKEGVSIFGVTGSFAGGPSTFVINNSYPPEMVSVKSTAAAGEIVTGTLYDRTRISTITTDGGESIPYNESGSGGMTAYFTFVMPNGDITIS